MSRREKMLEFIDEGYNISVCGRHVHVTEPMKQYAKEKIAKLERLGDRIIDVTVTMDIQKLQHKVDIVMKYGHTMIKSSAVTRDMYLSLDKAVEKLQAQLKKYLNRIHHHHLKAHPVIDIQESVYERIPEEDEVQVINQEIEQENKRRELAKLDTPRIISQEMRPLKILTNDEALMKMDLSQAEVMVFRGEEDRKLKVIYRRSDGNYGIIEAE